MRRRIFKGAVAGEGKTGAPPSLPRPPAPPPPLPTHAHRHDCTPPPGLDLDPRWDWVCVTRMEDVGPKYIKGACKHLETVPVESVTGETVARLCLTCDTQFRAE